MLRAAGGDGKVSVMSAADKTRPRLFVWAPAPALLWTALFFVLPLLAMAVTSLTRREHGETVAFWTLANYRTFFTEGSPLAARAAGAARAAVLDQLCHPFL
jgi:spermidine/putrescine transport system permease protein